MGLFWQKAGFCTGPRLYVVVFTVDDVLWPVVYHRWQFIDVNIDHGGCRGPSDAESWFRAETCYIRILNVSLVFAESVFLMTRRVFAESVFCWVSFCWVRQTIYWCGHWPRRLLRSEWRWIMIQSGNVLYTYTKRFAWVSVLMTRRVFAESVLLSHLVADEAR